MHAPHDLTALLSYSEVEMLLGMSHNAILRNFVRKGKLPAIRFNARTVRFRAEDVQRLIDEVLSGHLDGEATR